ncbi:MAG: GHMP kinase [Chloroflexi bacterium]|nr:GHMP kinase [Chloroflexota bacterium]
MNLFVPGRLCLFGEHSDWAGGYRRSDPELMPGYCLAVGTTQGINARAARGDGQLRVDSHRVNERAGSLSVAMVPAALEDAARAGGFYAYCAGVAAHVSEHYRVGGITIQTTDMNLPLKKGLSSSAAICVLTARAFNEAYELHLSIREEMEAAYLGEIRTGSQCGRLDQVCAYGQIPVFLTFDADEMDVHTLKPRQPIHMLIVDLKRDKDTRRILHELNGAFTSDSSIGRDLRDALGAQNRRVLDEARHAINAGDAETVGALMSEAQAIFDRQMAPACPSELTAPRLHEVLAHPRVRELAWGGKGVGSQGDGSAQMVARSAEAQALLLAELPYLLGVDCFELTIKAHNGGGA